MMIWMMILYDFFLSNEQKKKNIGKKYLKKKYRHVTRTGRFLRLYFLPSQTRPDQSSVPSETAMFVLEW